MREPNGDYHPPSVFNIESESGFLINRRKNGYGYRITGRKDLRWLTTFNLGWQAKTSICKIYGDGPDQFISRLVGIRLAMWAISSESISDARIVGPNIFQ